MKQIKKLLLKEEIEKEARKIEKKIINNADLEDICVSEKMEEELLAEIRAYEEKGVRSHKHSNNEEFSQEITPNFSLLTNDKIKFRLSDTDAVALHLGRELLRWEAEERGLHKGESKFYTLLDGTHSSTGQELRDAIGQTLLDEVRQSKGDEMEDTLVGGNLNTDKETKKKTRRFHFSAGKRLAAAVAVVCLMVAGMSMTSVGSKSYWKVLLERIVGEEKAQIINVADMDSQETADGEELNAYKEISNIMGISIIRFGFKPESMELENYSVDKEQRRAQLFYSYGGEVLRYSIYANDSDSSLGEKELDKLTDEFVIRNSKQEITIDEYEVENTNSSRYIANFEYQDIHYQIKGIVDKEDLTNIIENLVYFSY